MSGMISISSGTEDLSGVVNQSIEPSSEGWDPQTLLDVFLPDASMQSTIDVSVESLSDKNKLKDCDGEGECENQRPALVSRVIDPSDGHATITIIYDACPCTGGGDMSTICALINGAAENDVVDLTIATFQNFTHPKSSFLRTRALLSALENCKGKVITHAGVLLSMEELAVWLSGKEKSMSPFGWIFIRASEMCTGGPTSDVETSLAAAKTQTKEFADYIISKGWFDQEAFDKLINEQTTLTMTFDEIAEKLANESEEA